MRPRVRRDVGSRRDHSRPDLPRLRARVHRDMERLGLPPGAGHPACGHAVPAASPARSGLTLLQLHAGQSRSSLRSEDPLLSVLPFAQRVCQSSSRLSARLARMPYDREPIPEPPGGKNLREQVMQCLGADNRLRRAVRQIAIFAIDIAERGRLDHEQLNGRHNFVHGNYCTICSPVTPPIGPVIPVMPVIPVRPAPTPRAPAPVAPPITPGEPQLADVLACLAGVATSHVETASRIAARRSDMRAA